MCVVSVHVISDGGAGQKPPCTSWRGTLQVLAPVLQPLVLPQGVGTAQHDLARVTRVLVTPVLGDLVGDLRFLRVEVHRARPALELLGVVAKMSLQRASVCVSSPADLTRELGISLPCLVNDGRI